MRLSSGCRFLSVTLMVFIASIVATSGVSYGALSGERSDSPRGVAADSIIAEMVAGVSQDSIYNLIATISGETPIGVDYPSQTIYTRYASARGAEVSADYLKMMFERYGYSVELQYFHFTSNLRSVILTADGIGLAVGQNSRIVRRTGGEPWSDIRVGTDTSVALLLSVDHAGGSDFVTVGKKGAVLTSDDEGLSWVERNSGVVDRLDGVDVLADGSGWTVGVSGVILHTSTGGTSWASQTSGVASSLRDVWAFDESTAVVVGDVGVILLTDDGGATWNPVASPTSNDLLAVDCVGDDMWAVGDLGTIIVSDDRGETWSLESSGVTENLTGISIYDSSHGWAVGGNPGSGIVVRLDGATWTSQTSPLPGNTLYGVTALSADEAFAVGLSGAVIYTSNGGSNWTSWKDSIQAGMANVVATKSGSTTPDEVVVLGGHYDSISNIPDESAPGADDNGSGIAVIVEAARLMAEQQFERTIRFVCFSYEEGGLHGSAAYATRAASTGENIIGMFNLDSVGWNDDYFRIFSNASSAWLGDIADDMASVYAPTLTAYHWDCPSCTWSDHASFWNNGFDAICGIEPWDPTPTHHHTPGDTLGVMDMSLVANVTNISIGTIATVAGVDTAFTVAVPGGEAPENNQTVGCLYSVEPNPFNPTTNIRFFIPEEVVVRLDIYSVSGRLVRELYDTQTSYGEYAVTWNGRDNSGREVESGVYFVLMTAGDFMSSQKMVLVR